MSRKLDDLSPTCRARVVELLARLTEAGIHVFIVDTLRTPEEQAENIRKGVSWTKHSRHLTGDAIDVCPFETYHLHGPDKLQWDAADPIWKRIGTIGEACGLEWGGRWKQADLGHFQVPRPTVAVSA